MGWTTWLLLLFVVCQWLCVIRKVDWGVLGVVLLWVGVVGVAIDRWVGVRKSVLVDI